MTEPTTMTSPNLYEKKIVIVVQSKYPDILAEFKKTFFPTTEQYKNLRLVEITGDSYGAKEINKILVPANLSGIDAFGVFNDDLVFSPYWLDSVISRLPDFACLSVGYVETKDYGIFEKAREATKDENGIADLLYGPTAVFSPSIFKKIGVFDERFEWSCDDLDWALRIRQNGMRSGTLKKITVMHKVGETRDRNPKVWRNMSKQMKQRFYDKHGYWNYRTMRNEYQAHHRYFTQFK